MPDAAENAVARTGIKLWLWEKRDSTRLAFILQMVKRVANSLCALIWWRLLVGLMGKEIFDLFIAFKNVFSFGGLGDLGMGGAVALRVGKYLGAEKTEENEKGILKFLSCARSMYFSIALVTAVGLIGLSPWWLKWLGLVSVPGAGSMPLVAAVGAFLMTQVLLMSYVGNLNYACGNLTWPVIPSFVLLQLAFVGHWLLARNGAALWLQHLPYLVCSFSELALVMFYVRVSHPRLARVFPLSIDRAGIVAMLGSSVWVYICTLGNQVYQSTDGLVIKAGTARGKFPPGTLTDYSTNYKFCELAVFVAITASFVSLPKITQWMHSPDPKDQERVRAVMTRLNQFQTLMGCGAALAYLAANNLFMKIWWAHAATKVEPAGVMVQVAFALNMAVTASGDTGLQLSFRSGDKGIRNVGIAVGVTGLLNLALSALAMKYGVLWGVAMATVFAQCALSLFASHHLCRDMRLKWLPWVMKGCLAPVVAVSFAGWLRMIWPLDTLQHTVFLLSSYLALFLLGAWALGVKMSYIRSEMEVVRKMLGK